MYCWQVSGQRHKTVLDTQGKSLEAAHNISLSDGLHKAFPRISSLCVLDKQPTANDEIFMLQSMQLTTVLHLLVFYLPVDHNTKPQTMGSNLANIQTNKDTILSITETQGAQLGFTVACAMVCAERRASLYSIHTCFTVVDKDLSNSSSNLCDTLLQHSTHVQQDTAQKHTTV